MNPDTRTLMTNGSDWQRWDPHVHLPGTLLNDQFKNIRIDEALQALANCTPKIEAIGVTDYFTTRTFRAARQAWQDGAGSGIKYLFPNVELRLNDATAFGNGVNLHVLAAPEDVDVLDELLSKLRFNYQDIDYMADDAGLVKLGRKFKQNQSLEEAAARSAGANQFKVTFDDLKTLFQRDAELRAKCLVAVSAGKDGSSGMQSPDGGFIAYRQSLERFAHIMFTGRDQDRQFWLGQGKDDENAITRKYGGLKLCLHGSDAHQVAKLGKPDLYRFCWLKGALTFETIRLACLSPERRSSIGETSPGGGQQGRIDGVTVSDKTWFTAGTVPINTGLVAIIGERGSGKTALADLIAIGAGSSLPFENSASFVSRAGKLLTNQSAETSWHGDAPTTHDLSSRPNESSTSRRIRYLSQQFVERLCASDGVTSELLLEIERVIFEAWPVEQRQGATSFQDLLEIRLGTARASQRDELEAVTSLSEEIINQRIFQRGLKGNQDRLRTTQSQITGLEAQIKELTGKADSTSGERYGEVSLALAGRQDQLQALDRRMTDLRKLQSAVQRAKSTQFPGFQLRIRQDHPYSDLKEEDWTAFLPKFSGSTEKIIADALADADAEHKLIVGTPVKEDSSLTLDGLSKENLALKTMSELSFEQRRLQKLVGFDKRRSSSLIQLQTNLSTAQSAKKKLGDAIVAAQGAENKLNQLVSDRTERYEAYFNALLDEEAELRTLYKPLEKVLHEFGPSVAKLKLSVRRRVDLGSWVDYAEKRLIDLRIAGLFHGTGALRKVAEASLLEAWESGDGKMASSAIQEFSSTHSKSLRNQARVDTKNDDEYREWERDVAKWIYGVGHINVAYDLEYDGLGVERLSPGSRGIVLLLLYLAIDVSETDPLIIDQPEENLDPKSIYSELVKLFQVASDRRQIIMVTHNANLVVNTDVDQVIVASCDHLEEGKLPMLSYQAGGLEDPNIRSAVCEVLEGGAEAFKQRARRLQIDAPATLPV